MADHAQRGALKSGGNETKDTDTGCKLCAVRFDATKQCC